MNLSEKLAAADGGGDPPRSGKEDPASGKRPPRESSGGETYTPTKHPGRRATDRVNTSDAWAQSKQKVQVKVLAEIAPAAADLSPDELRSKVRSTVNEILEREDIGISPIERQRFVEEMLEDSLGYGPLEALLSDGTITEIMCNNWNEIWIERQGRIAKSEIAFNSLHQYRRIIERMVAAVGRRVDESSPMVDARLADGSRINAIVPPLAIRGPVLTIRKFPERALVMQDLISLGSVSMDAAVFLEACVRGKISMIVVGGTGTGKTTMLNVLSNFIPEGERLITIEESAELQLQGAHVVTLETRQANAEGTGEVRIRDLVRNSLRMRPDRIIVGECRGAETLDMLQAMNTGHAGSMTTVHANSPRELLSRLETMVMMGGVELPQRAIREQITLAVGLMVQLQRTPAGPRIVSSITEIQGMEGDTVLLQDIFHRVDTAEGMGRLVPTGLRPKILDELALNGVEVAPNLFRNDSDPLFNTNRSERRHHRPSRPGRVEPPSEEVYEMLAARRRDGK
jgi:pilus assembly protein CpaF